jgi:hypothetical protein
VRAATAQQALIPPAAGFDIRDTDEGLGAHGSYPNRSSLGSGNGLSLKYEEFREAV